MLEVVNHLVENADKYGLMILGYLVLAIGALNSLRVFFGWCQKAAKLTPWAWDDGFTASVIQGLDIAILYTEKASDFLRSFAMGRKTP